MSLNWYFERLDEMCARLIWEANAKAERLLEEMNTFEEYTFADQRSMVRRGYRWDEVPDRKPWSNWEIRRILIPMMLRELDELIERPVKP